MVIAKVAFEYSADQSDELDLKVGDIVTNIKMEDGGWWEGEVNGKRGMFPENFVVIQEEKAAAPPPALPAGKPAAAGPKKFARVTFQYDPEQPDELTLQVGDLIEIISEEDEGWWRGKLNDKVGMFPANFVEVVADEPSPAASQPAKLPEPIEPVTLAPTQPPDSGIKSNRPKSGFGISLGDLNRDKLKKTGKAVEPQQKVDSPPPVPKLETNDKKPAPSLPPGPAKETIKSVQKAKVVFAYEPEQADELKLVVGEVITIINKDVFDGWMQGELNGKSGLFPDNFVELLPVETVRVDDNELVTKPIESKPSVKRAAKENPSPVATEPPPVESPPPEKPAEKPKFGMPAGMGGFQAELSKRLGGGKSQAPAPPAPSKPKVGGKPPPPGPPSKPIKPKPPLPTASKPPPPVSHKPEGSASPPIKRALSTSKTDKPLPRTNSESRKPQPPKPAPPAVIAAAAKAEPPKEEPLKKAPQPVAAPVKEDNDEMDFNAVKSSDPLKHMQRAKAPGKNPPSKFKGSGESSGIDSKEADELKKEVKGLQDKINDMEKKFQKLLKQVNDELDKSRKVQSEQQIEIDRLRRNIDVLTPH